MRNWEKEPCVSYPWNKLYTRDEGGPTGVTFKNAQRCFYVGEAKNVQLVALNTLLSLRTLDVFCTAHLMWVMAFQGQFCTLNLLHAALKQDADARRNPIQNTAVYGSAARVAHFPWCRAVYSTDSAGLLALYLLNNYKKEIWGRAVTWKSKC